MPTISFEEWDETARHFGKLRGMKDWAVIARSALAVCTLSINQKEKTILCTEDWKGAMEKASFRKESTTYYYTAETAARLIITKCKQCGTQMSVTPTPDEDPRQAVCPSCRGIPAYRLSHTPKT